ncbi:MAG: phosphoserine phosphatase SerB [Halococcoides sp.]
MLVAFDFDGTLSDSEMVVELADRQGRADEVADITRRAMNDEIAYAESLRQRCAVLEGLDLATAEAVFEDVRLRPGTADVLADLAGAGVRTAILTGGFERGVRGALSGAGTDVETVVANRLRDDGSRLTGAVEGPLIEGTKDDALDVLAAAEGVDLEATVAVGDGANDLPMLETAGLAIGFDPKPAVEPACDVVVDTMPELRDVLQDRGVY